MDYSIESTYSEEKSRWEVALNGEVDIFSSAELKTTLTELVTSKNADLRIDCKNLEYIDSTALGALVAVLKTVKSYDHQMILVSVKPNISKLFKITNLDKVFVIEGEKNE